jgi:hypothetical protein
MPASAPAHDGTTFRAFGTAVIDGSFAAGEWDSAARVELNVFRSPAEGGGVVPATLYVMNDVQNLYFAIRVSNASVGTSRYFIGFDGNHDGNSAQEGEDILFVDDYGLFWDRFMHQISPTLWSPRDDDEYGGTIDGTSADGDDAGFATFELAHPLDDADNAHDFSLRPASRLGFHVSFVHCVDFTCAPNATNYFTRPDIVVVSGSTIPPDTQITAGPAEGSVTAFASTSFEFTGSDDVLQSSQLTLECKLDEGAWQTCISPRGFSAAYGRHTFSVRATDEMLNVDQSPAQRSWIRDSVGPSRPLIRGRRSIRKGKMLVLRFSATDEFTPRSGIRFKCAVDSTRLKRCSAVYRVRLRPGRHAVNVRAVDSVGNQSALTTFRVKVKRARR